MKIPVYVTTGAGTFEDAWYDIEEALSVGSAYSSLQKAKAACEEDLRKTEAELREDGVEGTDVGPLQWVREEGIPDREAHEECDHGGIDEVARVSRREVEFDPRELLRLVLAEVGPRGLASLVHGVLTDACPDRTKGEPDPDRINAWAEGIGFAIAEVAAEIAEEE